MVYTNNDPGNPSNAVTDDVLEHEINNNRKAQDGTVQYPEKLCVETPMLESLQMSKKVGYNVFLKLENMQPSGSFKLRGLSHHCIKVLEEGCQHLVASSVFGSHCSANFQPILDCFIPKFKLKHEDSENIKEDCVVYAMDPRPPFSERVLPKVKTMKDGRSVDVISGGNAGLAVAYIGRKLGVPVTIFVPETTPKSVIQRMNQEGAQVRVGGTSVDCAVEAATKVLQQGGIKGGRLIHPYDHPNIWEGHSFMVEEMASQLGKKPDLIVLSVGGGGLMCGILKGLHRVGWNDVPVLAMETHGANSFAESLKAGKPIILPRITSVATCLGVKTVTQQVFDWMKKHHVISEVISDAEAVSACIQLLDDHRMLVEPSCGAALAALYGETIEKLQIDGKLGSLDNVVVIVCGGCMVSFDKINDWKNQFKL